MRRNLTLFGVVLAVLSAATAVVTSLVLRSYDLSRPDLGSGTLPVQSDPYPVVVLGDSLAAGVGASQPENGLGPQLLAAVQRQHPEAQLHDLGQSGATTADVVNDQLPRLARINNPRLVVLVVGSNDIIQQVPEADFEAHWKALMQALAVPGRPLAVLNIPSFAKTPAVPDNLKGAAEALTGQRNRFIAQSLPGGSSIHLVDFYQLSASSLQPGSSLLSADQFHPNDAGYTRISAAVAGSLGL